MPYQIYYFDLFGVYVFAITGALAIKGQNFDIFGALVISLITALGGGTIRDLLLNSHPICWIQDINYILAATADMFTAILFNQNSMKMAKVLLISDAFGLSVSAIIGAQKALQQDLHEVIIIMMAVISGTIGGAIRDTLANRIPLLLIKKEIYAIAAVIGCIVYLLLKKAEFSSTICISISILVTLSIRLFSIAHNWSLPYFDRSEKKS